MKLKLTDDFSFFVYESKEEELIIKSEFTYEDKSLVFMNGKYDPMKIKRVCFVKTKKNLNWIHTGLLKQLLLCIKKYGIKVSELNDERTKFEHNKKDYTDEELGKYFPFDYNNHQVESLRRILKNNRGIIKAITGSGKADTLMAFLKEVKLPTLVLVDKIMLANQLAKRAKESGLQNVGSLNSKSNDIENKDIVFSTIGSVGKIPSFDRFKVLIVDEVHKSSAKRFQQFISSVDYPIQIGFSATPDKGDPFTFTLIRQHFGEVLHEIKSDEMIENEVIAKPEIKFIKNEVTPMIDWVSSYQECIVKNKERNNYIIDIIEKYNEKILVLIKDVKYGQGHILKKQIEENTTKKVEFIQGATKDREDILDWFENGDLDVLIATNILNEGVSLKEIRILVNASAGKSYVENLQKIGRGTRVMKDKKKVIVYDFLDLGNKFTQRHAKERIRIYKKEGFVDIELIDSV